MEISVGDVVQIDPAHEVFGGCFLVVTELRAFGVIGYVKVPDKGGDKGGDAYYRVKFEDITRIGQAEWVYKRHAVAQGEPTAAPAAEPSNPWTSITSQSR